MARVVKVIGSDEALKRLNFELLAIKGRTLGGMKVAANLVKKRSMDITPVDKNNLRPSHYIATGSNRSGPVVEIGCTANYAVYVHEDLEARHKEGKTAKFLEKSLYRSIDKIIEIIKKRAKIR